MFWLLISAIFVLIVPGAALLAWLFHDSIPFDDPHPDLLATLADSVGLSMSMAVLAALWLFIIRMHLPSLVLGALYGFALMAWLVAMIWKGMSFLRAFRGVSQRIVLVISLAVLAALLVWRFYQARALQLPVWVDPVHHVLIVRLILQNGGLPDNYLPYTNAPFFYHFGFHVIAALFTAWSRLPADQAVLWFGQVLNALVSLSIYRITYSLGGANQPNRRVGRAICAALLVGIAFQMPGYYLTWGRYTLLAGLVLLGPAMAAAVDIRDNPHRKDAWVRLVLLVSGLSLTHYFALFLAGLWIGVLGLFELARWLKDRQQWTEVWPVVSRLAAFSLLGILLAAPWLVRIWIYSKSAATVSVVDPLDQSSVAVKRVSDYIKYAMILLGPYHNHVLMGFSGVGLLAALRRVRVRPVILWALILVFLALPWGLRLGPFRPDHYVIILFFPAGILLAELLFAGASALGSLFKDLTRQQVTEWTAAGLITALILAWGGWATRNIINPVTVLATPADVAALNWVEKNTPPGARFYINSTPWQGPVYRGVDGGYWLEPYTGRFSLIPPAIYSWASTAEIEQIGRWAGKSNQLTGCTPDFWNIIREANLSYVYLREKTGHLQPEMLANCPRLDLKYQKDGVFIYQILPLP